MSCRLSLSFAPEFSVWLGKYPSLSGSRFPPPRKGSDCAIVRGSLRADASLCLSECCGCCVPAFPDAREAPAGFPSFSATWCYIAVVSDPCISAQTVREGLPPSKNSGLRQWLPWERVKKCQPFLGIPDFILNHSWKIRQYFDVTDFKFPIDFVLCKSPCAEHREGCEMWVWPLVTGWAVSQWLFTPVIPGEGEFFVYLEGPVARRWLGHLRALLGHLFWPPLPAVTG